MVRFVNFDEFERQLQAFATKTVADANKLRRAVGLDMLTRVVLKTPVDFGIARGNWQITVAQEPQYLQTVKDEGGGKTIEKGAGQLARSSGPTADLRKVIYIANATPYIEVLDRGLFVPPDPGPSNDPRKGRFGRVLVQNGFSVQAPQGIVDLSLNESRQRFSTPQP